MSCERKYSIWFHSYRHKRDFEYFRICLRDRPFNLKRGWEVGVVTLWFFLMKYFDAEFSRINYFCKQNAWNTYSDARFSLIKIAFFLLQGRSHSPLFKLKGRSLTRFHYYIFLPGYGYNGTSCGHCQIAGGVHWMEFVSHVKFRQLQTLR